MFDRFTDRARKVISFAREEAERYNHEHIGTEDLLLGLLVESSGVHAQVLEILGVDLELVRLEVQKLLKPPPHVVTMGQMPFTDGAKKVLLLAMEEARNLGHNYVGTEHLLLGLMCETKGLAAQALANAGLKQEEVREAVLKILGQETRPGLEGSLRITPYLEALLARKDLSDSLAAVLMTAIIEGRVGAVSIAAVAMALRAKGESVAELAAFAKVMRAHAVSIAAPEEALDVVGTGGDKSETFNVSTATAFVAAGLGIPIAKHGGRSVSSRTGSADVFTALGVKIEAPPLVIARCIKEAGIGFMYAPRYHPGMRYAAPVRKELGVRTVFNLLGPLSNPAGAKLSLLGVYDPSLCEKFAQVLKLLGARAAMVVCGAGPGGTGFLDEMSTFGPTTVARLRDGNIAMEQVDAQQFGLAVPAKEALYAADAAASARIIREVLNGQKGPARDIVVLNAAAAALVAGKAADWAEGLRAAERSIDEGRAAAALENLVRITNAASGK